MTDRATKREGWYTDPLGQAELRWWDSRNWTEHVKSARDQDPRLSRGTTATSLQWAEAEDFPTDDFSAAAPSSPSTTDNVREAAPIGQADLRMPPPPSRPAAQPRFALPTPSNDAEQPASIGPDWSELAVALLMAGDNIVRAKAAGIPELVIDMVERTFWWEWDLDSFPAHPVDLRIQSIPREQAAMPSVAGRFIEPLLWRVGTASLGVTVLGRVDPTLRYKLRRWPNLVSMPHTKDQQRMTTMLANAQLTPTELGAVAEVAERDVQVLISTFALMSLLDVVKDPAAAARVR